jgi:hypothetical protein
MVIVSLGLHKKKRLIESLDTQSNDFILLYSLKKVTPTIQHTIADIPIYGIG